MSVRAPLSVRIDDGATDRHVTSKVSDLTFRQVSPGGFHSCSFNLTLDPYEFPNLGAGDKVYVYGPNGDTLFEGFLDYPGASDSNLGRSLQVTAMGTLILTQDRSVQLVYIDRDLTKWEQVKASTLAVSASAGSSDDPSATAGGATTQGLLCAFASGQQINTNWAAQIGYSALVDAGMELGALSFTIDDGKTDSNFRTELVTSHGVGTAAVVTFGTGISTAVRGPFIRYVAVGGSTYPAGENRLALQLRRSGGATTVADEVTWSFFYDVSVLGRRMDATGALVSGTDMTTAAYVRADWVVADLMGRLLPGLIDVDASLIETTSYQIDQLTYDEGTTSAEVLDDLELFEPDMTWEMLRSTPRGYVFRYRARPTTPRYEISTRDDFEQTGAEFDLCNSQPVFYTDAKGRKQVEVVTATSATYPALQSLEDAGRVRDAEPITLPDGLGSVTNAQRIGAAVLATKATPPQAARATVRRPIRDLLSGGFVMPYEIKAGYPVRVRETNDILWLSEVDYRDTTGESELVLGVPVPTPEQRIARLERRVRRRRAA